MVINETTARKYFKQENPVGKQITVYNNNGKEVYTVTGVMEDFPANSHLDCEVLISYATLIAQDKAAQTSWNWNAFLTYLLLKPDVDVEAFEHKFPALINKYKGKDLAGTNVAWQLSLQALPDIHLFSDLKFEAKQNGDHKTVYLLAGIALLCISIAWSNYINMSTAKAMQRAKEVGIRKVIGSTRKQLIFQFLIESFLLNSIALLAALSIIQLLQPVFSQFAGLPLSNAVLFTTGFWIILLLIVILGSILSGLYPAFVLSSFAPIQVLKGNKLRISHGLHLREVLVIGQFAASILLIAGTLAINEQLHFMYQKDLGMNINQILVFKTQNVFPEETDLVQSTRLFKQELLKHSSVKAVTTSSSIPGEAITWATNDFRREGKPFTQANDFAVMSADQDFIHTYDMQLLAGRFFLQNTHSDQKAVVINETALQALGFANAQEAINEVIVSDDFDFKHRIIGVVKDFHQKSLQNIHRPMIFIYQEFWFNNYYAVKVDSENMAETIGFIKAAFEGVFPGNPFDYFFQDEYYNAQYKADQQFGQVFSLFTGLAIFVACLGLFGLVSFAISMRTKEIGVRKVLGASIGQIASLLTKDFIKLILLANLIAWPLAYWTIHSWLENYAFRIDLNVWLFILPSLLVLLIALITISFQTIKAARANPVKALRSE
jgi:putative ABC transport system permease protein